MKEKTMSVIRITLSAAIMVLAVLQLVGVWKNAIYVYEPLVGVLMLLQAQFFWNRSRSTAVINLCAAIFVLIAAAVILLIR